MEETVETPENGDSEEIAAPSDEENADTEGDDISNEVPADEDPVEEEPSEEEVVDPITSVNVTFNEGEEVEYDVTGIGSFESAGYKVSGEAKAKEKVAYTFNVEPADETYEITAVTYTVGEGDDAKTTKPEIAKDGKYTIPAAEVTGKIEIAVTAAKIKYTVTANYTEDDVEYTAKGASFKDGKIETGTALEFTVTAKDGSKITQVSYTMAGKKTDANAETDGSYKVVIEKVTGDITITIKSVKIYTVKFPKGTSEKPSNVTAITDIKIDGTDADPKSLGADDTKWEVSVENGQKISFKVSTADPFKVKDVTIDGKSKAATAVAVSNGVYSFRVREDANLTIATELNPEKCGAFKVTVNGDEDSATATVKLPTGVENADEKDYDILTPVVFGDKILTQNKKVVLAIEADTDYEISKVEIGGKEAEAKTPATESAPAEWEIELTAGTETAVVVTTTPKATAAAGKIKVIIDDAAKEQLTDLTVKAVMANESKVLESAEGGVYVAPEGSKTVEITVTAANGVRPSHDSENLTGPTEATVSGKKTYTYTILASKLKTGDVTPDTVTFTKEDINYSISFTNDLGVNVSVSIDGQELTSEQYATIAEGETVAVRVENGSSLINSVEYTVGNTRKTVKANKGAAAFTVKMTDDVYVFVHLADSYTAATLKDSANKDVPADGKGVYNVSYDGTYTVGLREMGSIAKVEVKDGTKVLEDEVTIGGTDVAPTIKLTQAVAGRKLTVKLYVEDRYGDYVDTKADYTLQVTKVVSKITAPKIVKQATDTEKRYKVTTDGELSKLSVTSSDTNVVSSAILDEKTNEVVITATQTPGKAEVTITDGDKVSSKIEVTTEALISGATAAPTVALSSATDVALSLTVGAKNIADDLVSGAVWYQVEVKPQGEASAIPTGLKKTVDTKYVKKTGESQTISVVVGEGDLGTGHAWKYDVKVSLVHVKDKDTTFTGTDSDIVMLNEDKAQSNAFESGSKPFATLEPAWESNLKLKKGQATLTTGEGPVTIATPQFSKPTTYKTLTVSDLTYPDSNTTGLKVEEKNGVIVATAAKGTALGKHTIEVVAAANKVTENYKDEEGNDATRTVETMYASKATIVVTVVQGINTLRVQVPSLSVYKAAGKPATLKATAVFNDGTKATQPKAKNVDWKIVKADGTTPWPDNKITVKNGTVTIAKDYILKANPKDNQFKIKVSVVNTDKKYVGAADSITSDTITITNKGAQVTAVAIVQITEEKDYKVVAKPEKDSNGKIVPAPVQATDINGGLVYAFNTADIKDVYSTEEEKEAFVAMTVPLSDLTIKSSKAKNVEVNDNVVKVNSPAKGVKLTVTANDGSKNKAELALDVNPDGTTSKDLALKITTADNGNVYTTPTTKLDSETVTVDPYSGSAVSRVKIDVLAWNESADGGAKYETVPRYANYTLKVKKGGKLSGPDSEGVYTATLDKRDIEITLANDEKKTWTYKLTNKDILDTKALKISAKALNTLHPEGTTDEQKVNIQLSNVDQTKYEGYTGVYADVEVDWSKKNDKNAGDLAFIASNLSDDSKELVAIDSDKKTAKFVLSFTNANHRFTQSSYALKVTLRGTKTEQVDGKELTKEEAVSQPAAVTVKVDKVKNFTFKPTTSYTIGSKDGYAVVSGKSSIPADDLNFKFEKLLNLADKNGQENKFTKNIELTEDGKLKVKADAKTEDLVAAHLTGYLQYTATTDAAYYNTKNQSGVVKITVKIKDNNSSIKYTHDAETIGFKKDSEAAVTVKVNTKDAIKAPVVTVKAAKIKSTKDPIEVTVSDGKLVVKLTDNVNIKTTKAIKADIYIQTNENTATLTPDEDWSKKTAVVKLNLPVNATLKIDDTLKTAITNAVNGAIGSGEGQIKITADTKWADIQEKIMAAAESALGENSDFEVVADEETALTISEDGKTATIELTVRQKNLTNNSAKITVSGIVVSEAETPTPES